MSAARVLIADDDEAIHDLIRRFLVGEPRSLETVDNGQAALDRLLGNEFDVAVLDLYMPGLNGLEVIEAMQEKEIDTDVVLVTAYGTREGTLEKAIRAIKRGAVDCVAKPFDMDDLIGTIRRLLERRMPSPHVLAARSDEFLQERCSDEAVHLDELAEILGISPGYASKLLREHFDASFRERLSFHRIKLAKEMILAGLDQPLKTISERCGFRTQSRFTETFSRVEGVSPKRFRELHGLRREL